MKRAVELVDREWSWFVDALRGAGPEVWDRPTRLTGWDVEALARHAHWAMTLETDALASVGTSDRAAGRHLRGPRKEVVGALDVSRAGLVEGLRRVRDVPADAPVPMPYGDLPLALMRNVFVMEASVHRSDLAHALGDPAADLAGDAAPSCAAVLTAFWGALAAGARTTPPAGTGVRLLGETVTVEAGFDGLAWGPLTDEPTVVLSGDDVPLMLYAYGRLPFDAARLQVTGDHDLAVRLKELVPGP